MISNDHSPGRVPHITICQTGYATEATGAAKQQITNMRAEIQRMDATSSRLDRKLTAAAGRLVKTKEDLTRLHAACGLICDTLGVDQEPEHFPKLLQAVKLGLDQVKVPYIDERIRAAYGLLRAFAPEAVEW